MVAELRKRLIRRATANDDHAVFEHNALMIHARFHEQRITRATIIDTQADRLLRSLPGLAVIAVLSVGTNVPRSSRRLKRRCHEDQYEKKFFH